jgi:hypothetical protein
MQSKPAVEVDVVEALSQGRVSLERGIRDWWQEGFRLRWAVMQWIQAALWILEII